MKKLLCSLFLLPALVFGGEHNIETLVNGGTNGLAGLSTNTVAVPATVTRGGNALIAISFAAPSGSTSNLIVRLDRSVDNELWQTSFASYPIAATGTTTNTHATNFIIGAVGYLRVNLCNTNAAVDGARMTNVFVAAGTKPGI